MIGAVDYRRVGGKPAVIFDRTSLDLAGISQLLEDAISDLQTRELRYHIKDVTMQYFNGIVKKVGALSRKRYIHDVFYEFDELKTGNVNATIILCYNRAGI